MHFSNIAPIYEKLHFIFNISNVKANISQYWSIIASIYNVKSIFPVFEFH